MKKSVPYDQYYRSPALFGEPYRELLTFYEDFPLRGTLLDLGCGQGRDALALAGMGFEVSAIDQSSVGIAQMMAEAQRAKLKLRGEVMDIYQYQDFAAYDFILLDSMFHFGKKERSKEIDLVIRMMRTMRKGAIISFCIANTGQKVKILLDTTSLETGFEMIQKEDFTYHFIDQETEHRSSTPYKMVSFKKLTD